jgi:hypothetical protein
MFNTIKEFIFGKPAPVADVVAPGGAPYKIDPVVSGEDRTGVAKETPSHIQNEQRQHTATVAEHVVIPAGTEASIAAPVKQPRTPKAVIEKTVVKKAAPVKKAAAIKAAPKSKKV